MEYIVKVKDSEPLPIMTSEYYYLTVNATDVKSARVMAEEYAQGDTVTEIREKVTEFDIF